jgi:hypothetical protein
MPCSVVEVSYVSKEMTASISRSKSKTSKKQATAATCLLITCSANYLTLKMEEVRFLETSVNFY